jgi:hypothetical protein
MSVDIAVAVIGFVVLVDAFAPLPIPNFRPFNCPLCKCTWLALVVCAYFFGLGDLTLTGAAATVGLVVLATAILSVQTPWLWRQFPRPAALEAEPSSDSSRTERPVPNPGETSCFSDPEPDDIGSRHHA